MYVSSNSLSSTKPWPVTSAGRSTLRPLRPWLQWKRRVLYPSHPPLPHLPLSSPRSVLWQPTWDWFTIQVAVCQNVNEMENYLLNLTLSPKWLWIKCTAVSVLLRSMWLSAFPFTEMSTTFFQCTCPPGYIGNGIGPLGCTVSGGGGGGGTVVVPTNACANNPCRNGATCTQAGNTFACTCPLGYTGKFVCPFQSQHKCRIF